MKIKKNQEKFIVVPGLFSLTTNVDYIFHFILGPFMYKFFSKGKTRLNFSYIVKKDIKKPPKLNTKLEYFWGKNGDKRIYYEHPFLGRIKLKMLVEKQGNSFNFLVNRFYYKYIKFIVGRVWTSGLYLQDAAALSLSSIGFAMIHGACVAKGGQGILIFGSPKSGKSLTAFSLFKKGHKLLCDDCSILDSNSVYATSSRSSYFLKYFSRMKNGWRQKYYNFFSKIPVIGLVLFCFAPQSPPSLNSFRKFLDNNRLEERAKIKKVFILERGENKVEKITPKDALRRILILNRASSFHYNDTFLQALFYFNPEININFITTNEEKIVSSIVNQADCYLLQANDPRKYSEYIECVDRNKKDN